MVYDRYAFAVPQEKQVRLITDTDAKNEADDQFAVVQALLSPKIDSVGLIAAHFGTDRVPDAMEASYRELETILDKMYLPKDGLLYHGAPHALPDRTAPVVSEGAKLIVREALKDDPRRLFVIFLGPLTDLASAYLMEPRIANRLLRRVRDFAQVHGGGVITRSITDEALERLEIDRVGLDEVDRRMLRSIIEFYNGGPVGLETLAATINEEAVTLEDVYEPYLLQKGFLTRTPRGRCATKRAYEHLGIEFLGQQELSI